jgi:hypothetical protein
MFLTFITLWERPKHIGLEWIVAEFSQVIRSFLPKPPEVSSIFCLDSIDPLPPFSAI